MSLDHKVQPRAEKALARLADEVRKLAQSKGRYIINITDLISRVLVDRYRDDKGLTLVLTKGTKYDEPAFVKFRKVYPRVILTVQRTVWEEAEAGGSYPYFVLAHEIAHIILHDHKAVAFTNDPSLHIQYALSEDSAEWQADTFAKHLTMPDDALRDTRDPALLSVLCNVEERTARERIKSYLRTGPMHEFSYDENSCRTCGSFTLVHNGTDTRCDTCGDIVHELARSN